MNARNALKIFTTFVLCGLLAPMAVGVTAFATLVLWPTPFVVPTVKTGVQAQISHLYDSSGNEIGLFRLFEQNIPVDPSDISPYLKDAAVASEDRKFYSHGGVEFSAIIRAAYADFISKKIVQGGSTITQQYVRNAFLGRQQTLSRKLREVVLASRVDSELSKDDILFRYLSTIYFGDGAYGIGAAAKTYFQKSPKELTISEAAMLVGVLPAPTVYAPRENPKNAEDRRKVVLKKMFDQGFISQTQYNDALLQQVWLLSQGPPPANATVIYPPQTEAPKYPYFYDYVRQYLIQKYGQDVVFRGGLEIQTTLDPTMQAAAEKTVADSLKGTANNLEMSIVSVEPQTGFVRAFVGGRDYSQSQTNLALGGCPNQADFKVDIQVKPYCWSVDPKVQPVPLSGGTGRQPGSSWKPFVLATAYSQGIKPTARYEGSAYTVPHCTPSKKYDCVIHNNADGEGAGKYTLDVGTAESINGVFARLIHDTGFTEVADMAKKLGITSAYFSKSVNSESGSYALGEIEVSPLDMAGAYSVFANRGLRESVTPIVKVVDATGKVLEDNTKREGTRVLDANVADNVTNTLKGVIKSGTASRNGNIGRPAAGKTGTVEGFTDAWFVGYTPSLSTAVWLGHRDNRDPIVTPRFGAPYGGNLPTYAWATYMKSALKDVPPTDFNQPAPIVAPADLEKIIKARQQQTNLNGFIDAGPTLNKPSLDPGSFESGQTDPTPDAPSTTTTIDDGSTTTTSPFTKFTFPTTLPSTTVTTKAKGP